MTHRRFVLALSFATFCAAAHAQTPTGNGPRGPSAERMPPVLHCGAAGEDTHLSRRIVCGIFPSSGEIAAPEDGTVWLLDARGQRVAARVTASQWTLTIEPTTAFTPGARYELDIDRFLLRTTDGQVITVRNAEESVGRYRMCFTGGEDFAMRGSPSSTVNGCEREREIEAHRPAFLQNVRRVEGRRPGQTTPDTSVNITRLLTESYDPMSGQPLTGPRPEAPPLSLRLLSATGTSLGNAWLDCTGRLCIAAEGAAPVCFRANVPVLNEMFFIRSNACR